MNLNSKICDRDEWQLIILFFFVCTRADALVPPVLFSFLRLLGFSWNSRSPRLVITSRVFGVFRREKAYGLVFWYIWTNKYVFIILDLLVLSQWKMRTTKVFSNGEVCSLSWQGYFAYTYMRRSIKQRTRPDIRFESESIVRLGV